MTEVGSACGRLVGRMGAVLHTGRGERMEGVGLPIRMCVDSLSRDLPPRCVVYGKKKKKKVGSGGWFRSNGLGVMSPERTDSVKS